MRPQRWVSGRSTNPAAAPLDRRLARAVHRARLAQFWEMLWPPLAAILCVAALFAAVSWFGLWIALPPVLRIGLLIAFALAALYFAAPLLRLHYPSRAEALRRLELSSGLDHRPLAALTDSLGGAPDAATRTLWETHRRRMAERLGRLRAGLPSPRLDRRDPYALRALVALLFVASFLYAGEDRQRRIEAAFETRATEAEARLRVDAWVAPPAYTGRPPIVLTSGGDQERGIATMAVPQKSTVVVRVEGGEASVHLVGADGSTLQAEPSSAAGQGRLAEFRVLLEGDAAVRVVRGESEAARWQFTVEPDRIPTIAFAKEPEVALSGALKLTYTVEDDYGVIEAEARFEPVRDQPVFGETPAEARPLYGSPQMRLSLPSRRAKTGTAETFRDLTEHPWAGAKVRLTLAARDEADQWGTSEVKEIELPSRRFTKPLARAVIEQRRTLALDANAKDLVIRALGALMIEPERRIKDTAVYLGLSSSAWRLKGAKDDDTLRSVVDQLWEVALRIEDGDLSLAERELRAAQEALRKALEDGASDEEIQRLMQNLREAMNRFLNELMAELQKQPPMDPRLMPPDAQVMRPQDLDRMLQQLEELARSGARDAARELLAQLQNMMENLRMGRLQQQQQGGQQSQMSQALDRLGEMIREQQRLMNETFRRGQQGQGQRQQGRPGQRGQQGQQGEQGDLADALRQLQQGQGDLRRQLQQLLDQLGQMGMGDNQQLGEAGQAMGEAERQLGQGAPGEAVDDQAQALDRLRSGAQSLQQDMAQQMGPGQGPIMERGYANEDPLGRPRRNEGPDFGTTVRVPDEIDTQRARAILEELRRRLSEPNRPKLELDYLERLLERF